jgi:hypothetical protein
MTWADELVPASCGGLAVHGNGVPVGPGPRDSKVIECASEQAEDVFGSVREVVAHATHAAVVGHYAASVAFDQTPNELARALIDERLLPRRQLDWPCVFHAGAVLWEKARPVFRTQRNLDAVHLTTLQGRRALSRHRVLIAVQQRPMIPGYLVSRKTRNRQTCRPREMQPSPRYMPSKYQYAAAGRAAKSWSTPHGDDATGLFRVGGRIRQSRTVQRGTPV